MNQFFCAATFFLFSILGLAKTYLIVVLAIYFLPTFIAFNTRKILPVFIINLLFGWSGIGWLAALIWAVKAVNGKKADQEKKDINKGIIMPVHSSSLNMTKIIIILLMLAFMSTVFWFIKLRKSSDVKSPPPVPIALKKHSAVFNRSVDSLVAAYLDMKNAFVEDDSAAAKRNARLFINHINSFPMEEMKKDTAMVFATVEANLGDIKANAESLLKQPNIKEMRKDFDAVTEQMYPSFFTAINYEGPTLYYTNCPMAFDDTIPANWISNSPAIRNPYLGKRMLTCGEVKDSIKAK